MPLPGLGRDAILPRALHGRESCFGVSFDLSLGSRTIREAGGEIRMGEEFFAVDLSVDPLGVRPLAPGRWPLVWHEVEVTFQGMESHFSSEVSGGSLFMLGWERLSTFSHRHGSLICHAQSQS
jgi:hypothetical protein